MLTRAGGIGTETFRYAGWPDEAKKVVGSGMDMSKGYVGPSWNTNISRALIFAILQKMMNLRHLISRKLTKGRLKKPFFLFFLFLTKERTSMIAML